MMKHSIYFNKTFSVERLNEDGTSHYFSTRGINKMSFCIDRQNNNSITRKCIFMLSPEFEIMPGDIICNNQIRIQITKVEELCDIDGNLQCYRCENV
jgi:hypothetical protein